MIGLCVLALVGVFGYDGVKTGIAASNVSDSANQIARDSANFFHTNPDVNATYNQALAEASSAGDTLPVNTFTVNSNGAVTLTLHRANTTLLLGRLHHPLDTMTSQATGVWTP